MLASTVALAPAANAAVIINIDQKGTNVVATTSGTINITGLRAENVGSGTAAAIVPSSGLFSAVETWGVTFYSGLGGPSTIGSGGFTFATSSTGTAFYILGNGGLLGVPTGYVSGAPLDATTTFGGQTFASLGVTPGTYNYTVPNDTITLNVGALVAAVPEPATWAMMLLGMAGVGFAMRRNAKQTLRVRYT